MRGKLTEVRQNVIIYPDRMIHMWEHIAICPLWIARSSRAMTINARPYPSSLPAEGEGTGKRCKIPPAGVLGVSPKSFYVPQSMGDNRGFGNQFNPLHSPSYCAILSLNQKRGTKESQYGSKSLVGTVGS